MKTRLITGAALFFIAMNLFAQGQPYEGPDDPAGDIAAEREGFMTGNRIHLYFQNTTELSNWVDGEAGAGVKWSQWPSNANGVKMLDGIALLIGARVYVANDSIPITDPAEIESRSDLDTLYFLQTSYREEMDRDPTGTIEWGFYPVFGYFNESSEFPAMSNLSSTWPTSGWPATGRSTKWPGEWNGRFGRGVIYADMETYFVVNDAQDQEFLGPEDQVKYYPKPGKYIGDLKSDVTIQKGKPWGGLGLRVEQRGFQWNNPQARDAIFWEYTIANVSDYDIPDVAFGYWVDNGIGAERDDELGFFDRHIDMAYSWDIDGIGAGGLETGTMGFAYLESPGLPFDFKDNDEDGLLDEQRDNEAMQIIGPTDGIADLNKFLTFYNLELEDLRDHWDADEDQDWDDGEDLNGDGIYQANEFAGDDVGLDGVGPGELNYDGPDEGEGNHRPDSRIGVGSEPDFNLTDVNESDMVGLTSFRLFPVPSHASDYRWFRGDRSMWDLIGQDSTIAFLGNISNLIETFASGPFPLHQGRTERISMSELHSYDPLQGLNSDAHTAPALFEQKRIVQVIYDKDYRFAQPPETPTLTATPGDGFVILSWDDRADTQTRDPFVGNENDFEGYKIFRSSDKNLADAEVITDGFGTPLIKKPIFQCDLIDEKFGFTDFGLVNGIGYNLGFDSGIVHHFIDNEVENGRTYYYAISSYDYGAPDIEPGIAPSESPIIIDLDEDENVRGFSKNVAIVTPRTQAPGYVPPSIEVDTTGVVYGSPSIIPEVLSKNSLKIGHTYAVRFKVDTLTAVRDSDYGLEYINNGLSIYDLSDSALVYEEGPEKFPYSNLVFRDSMETVQYWTLNPSIEFSTDVFDGMRLRLENIMESPQVDINNSGWLVGSAPIRVIPTEVETKRFPWDYDIVFTNDPAAYKGQVTIKTMRDENNSRLPSARVLTEQEFSFYVLNKSFTDENGDYLLMDMVVHDLNGNGTFDILEDRVLIGGVTSAGRWAGTAFIMDFQFAGSEEFLPKPDDVLRITFNRPFMEQDEFRFTVNPEGELQKAEIKTSLDSIKVVPNPYVATNSMEPAVQNPYLNQRRRIMFTHLPALCEIKIFTSSGVLVDEIFVNNASDNGATHWDLLSSEGLEIAAGVYIFHVKALATGDEKIGKFAVIK
ncbi:MAG: hypothetical protein DWQ10_00420 [Calditrichaeota bacterium]|nr:MAG: hypothetical protein DWQ10_00420 [Calditrichota bacterium]